MANHNYSPRKDKSDKGTPKNSAVTGKPETTSKPNEAPVSTSNTEATQGRFQGFRSALKHKFIPNFEVMGNYWKAIGDKFKSPLTTTASTSLAPKTKPKAGHKEVGSKRSVKFILGVTAGLAALLATAYAYIKGKGFFSKKNEISRIPSRDTESPSSSSNQDNVTNSLPNALTIELNPVVTTDNQGSNNAMPSIT